MRKVILLVLIGTELLVLLFIVLNYNNYKTVFSPINENSTVKPSTRKLKYFYEPKPNSTPTINEWVPFNATYVINSDTLHEQSEYPEKKNNGTFRIITLGDSFTFGLYVDTNKNWTEKLEHTLNTNAKCKNINKYEVINLGVYGYDIDYSIERYRLRGVKYKPDLVIWFIRDGNVEQFNEILKQKTEKYFEEMKKNGEFERELSKGNLYPAWNKANKEIKDEFSEDKIINAKSHVLESFTNLYNGDLLIINFQNSKVSYQNMIKNFLNKYFDKGYYYDKIPMIDEQSKTAFPNDGHPTEKGHELIANEIYNYFTKSDLSPCS